MPADKPTTPVCGKITQFSRTVQILSNCVFSFYSLYDYSLQVVHLQVEQNATAETFNIKNPPDVNIREHSEHFLTVYSIKIHLAKKKIPRVASFSLKNFLLLR